MESILNENFYNELDKSFAQLKKDIIKAKQELSAIKDYMNKLDLNTQISTFDMNFNKSDIAGDMFLE